MTTSAIVSKNVCVSEKKLVEERGKGIEGDRKAGKDIKVEKK